MVQSYSTDAGTSSSADPSSSDTPSSSARSWKSFFERTGRRKARPGAWRERMPRKGEGIGRYGMLLRERDEARFERMRLILGFYDQPENVHLPRPPPVKSVMINNLQTLFFTGDVDSYYK